MARRGWLFLPFLAYLPVLWGDFNFDDIATVLRNPVLGDWTAMLSRLASPGSRALFYLSLDLDQLLWGMKPGGYHLTSLAVHLLDTALLAALVRRLAALRGEPTPDRAGLAAGLLFGLHPLTSSAACYVAQRGALLVGAALLTVLHLLLGWPGAPAFRTRGILAGIVCWLGLLAKPNGVVIPLCALALLPLLPAGGPKDALRRWLAAAVPLSLAFGLWGLHQAMQTPYQRATWDVYALTQFRVLWRYAALCLLPLHQNLDPGVAASTGWLAPWTTLIGALGLLALLAWTFRPGRSPWTRAGLLLALAALMPESSVVGLPDRMFEYRMYVPLLGLVLAAVPLFPLLRPRAAVPLLACLALLTTGRSLAWRSDTLLWREALRLAPQKIRPHANLSVRYRLQGRPERAEALIRRAIRVQPLPEQYRDLALIALERGEVQAGLDALEPVFRKDPHRADCLPVLGRLQLLAGRFDAAVDALTRAREAYPADEDLLLDLATAFALTGRVEEAAALRPELRRARGAGGLFLLGSLQGSQGHLREAKDCLLRFTALEPDNPLGWANLAQTLHGLGEREEAREARRRGAAACGDNPAYAELRRELERSP